MIAVLVLVLGLALLEYILDCRTMLEELLCPLTNQPAQVTQATPHPAFRASTANSASTSAANSAHRRNLPRNPCPQCVLNGGRESTSINASYQCFCQQNLVCIIWKDEKSSHPIANEFECSFLFPAFVPSYARPGWLSGMRYSSNLNPCPQLSPPNALLHVVFNWFNWVIWVIYSNIWQFSSTNANPSAICCQRSSSWTGPSHPRCSGNICLENLPPYLGSIGGYATASRNCCQKGDRKSWNSPEKLFSF